MLSVRTGVAFVVSAFVTVGVALGVVGFMAMRWAQVQFVTAAGGASPERFGPILLAIVFFETTVAFMLAGPVLAGMISAMIGSRFRRPQNAAVVGGGGSFLGFFALMVPALLGASLVGGPGTEQFYTPGSAVGPLFVAGVATALSGAVTGAVGSWGGR